MALEALAGHVDTMPSPIYTEVALTWRGSMHAVG